MSRRQGSGRAGRALAEMEPEVVDGELVTAEGPFKRSGRMAHDAFAVAPLTTRAAVVAVGGLAAGVATAAVVRRLRTHG